MKLTKADREYIRRNFWEDDKNIDQIEAAIGCTWFEYKNERIGVRKAIELIGREKFLSGMDRSAFHRTATVTTDEGIPVYFDSSKYFTGRWPRRYLEK